MAVFRETHPAHSLFAARQTNISFKLTEEKTCGRSTWKLKHHHVREGKAACCVTLGKLPPLSKPSVRGLICNRTSTISKGCLAFSEEGGWKRGCKAGTEEHSTSLWSYIGLPTLKTGKCTCFLEELRGNPTGTGLGTPQVSPTSACHPPFRAATMPGVALWVQSPYLMLASACSEPCRGRWWGQPQKQGRGTAFIS